MTKCPELLPALQLKHSWNNKPRTSSDTVVKKNAWKHSKVKKTSICGGENEDVWRLKCLWPFSLQFRGRDWTSFKIGIDRNSTPTRPPTPSHQTAHSFFRPHLFRWSSDYREAEAPYGCALLQLPLGQSSWPDSGAPPHPHTEKSTVRSLFQLSTSYV